MEQQKDGGAFWYATDKETGQHKIAKSGEKYWTGTITIGGVQYPATMFFTRQENKKNPRQPDFSIAINQPRQ